MNGRKERLRENLSLAKLYHVSRKIRANNQKPEVLEDGSVHIPLNKNAHLGIKLYNLIDSARIQSPSNLEGVKGMNGVSSYKRFHIGADKFKELCADYLSYKIQHERGKTPDYNSANKSAINGTPGKQVGHVLVESIMNKR